MLSYLLIVFVPCILITDKFDALYLEGTVESKGAPGNLAVKKVSYRRLVERRGSWPLAYKNLVLKDADISN